MIEASGFSPRIDASMRDPNGGERRRGPPRAIQFLLPVWGAQYIGQFLQCGLPTLLAPHNLPLIAKSLPCKFSFLTSLEGAEILREHPAVVYLRNICDVEIRNIEDLITDGNYSTTITLAYARAVQEAGAAMLDTCFFFLISDYIMADGSLGNVMKWMQAGSSGVVAGNFQVVEEDAREPFFDTFDTGGVEIVLEARDLMRWALRYLHPMTIANMVNYPLCHSSHSNRLFWRIDKNTLIGRFYLMHMICIRPETTDFKIGASCDYSFVPEMCPSGNVHVLTDSDEYLVVEMQPHDHEHRFLRLGAFDQKTLITSLTEWTTAVHRKNAHSAVVYHASDMPADIEVAIADSKTYVEAVEKRLPAPQPYRDHPYWIGAVAAFQWEVLQRKSDLSFNLPRKAGILFRLFSVRDFVFGRPPRVRPWHPRWPDYRMITQLAYRYFESRKGQILIISDSPRLFRGWLSEVSESVVSMGLGRFLQLNVGQYEEMIGEFEGCLVVLRKVGSSYKRKLIAKIKHVLRSDSSLLIFMPSGDGVTISSTFNDDLLQDVSGFFDPDLTLDEVKFVRAGRIDRVALRGMRLAINSAMRNPIWLPFAALFAAFVFTITAVGNLRRRGAMQLPRGQLCSSFAVALRKKAADSAFVDIERDVDVVSPLELAARRFSTSSVRLASTTGAGHIGS